uniref:Uncharacterized protein n=1 Tax=Amphimedon queenslandica TaxID=400682 RepID=A0A1X7VTT5_AMPQE
MGLLMAKDDEPTFIWWIGQANTPRLKARYWLQFGIFNIISLSVILIGIPALILLIPATIFAYQAVIKYDEGDEGACKTKTSISSLLSILSMIVFVLCVGGTSAAIYQFL